MNKSHREFLKETAAGLAVLNFCELAFARKLMAAKVSPIFANWQKEVHELARSKESETISQLQWQSSIARLYDRVPLEDLLSFIDFEKLVMNTSLPTIGESFVDLVFPKLDGLPNKTSFYSSSE